MAEATLNDVIDELKSIKKIQENTSDNTSNNGDTMDVLVATIRKQFDMIDQTQERARLDAQEKARETKKLRVDLKGKNVKKAVSKGTSLTGLGVLSRVFAGTALGRVLTGGFIGKLIKNLTVGLAKPLMLLSKFLVGGKMKLLTGAILAAVGIFKMFENNPEFQRVVEEAKIVFKESVLPAIQALGNAFVEMGKSEEMQAMLSAMSIAWGDFKDWMSVTFWPSFEKVVINSFRSGLVIIEGIFTGITNFLNGDFRSGFDSLWNALKGIGNLVSGIVQFVLELVGLNFGDKDLITWLKDLGKSIDDAMLAAYDSTVKFFTESIPNWFKSIEKSVSDFFSGMITGAKDAIKENVDIVVSKVRSAMDSIKGIYDEIVDEFTKLVTWVRDLPGRVLDYAISLLPEWLRPASDAPSLPAGGDALPLKARTSENGFSVPKSMTADEMKAAQDDRNGGGAGALAVTTINTSNSNTDASNNTTIYGAPPPFDSRPIVEY